MKEKWKRYYNLFPAAFPCQAGCLQGFAAAPGAAAAVKTN